MALLNRYEDAASAFLQAYPVGSVVHGDEIITWAHDHGNGLASDLLVDDPSKKLSALRRHLNAGASSHSFAEAERFYVEVTDTKNKVFEVISLADHTHQQTEQAFGKSVRGAMSPITASKKAIDNVKLYELDKPKRDALQSQLEDLVQMAEPLGKLLTEQVIGHYAKKLIAKHGITAQQARHLLEMMPELKPVIPLLKATGHDK